MVKYFCRLTNGNPARRRVNYAPEEEEEIDFPLYLTSTSRTRQSDRVAKKRIILAGHSPAKFARRAARVSQSSRGFRARASSRRRRAGCNPTMGYVVVLLSLFLLLTHFRPLGFLPSGKRDSSPVTSLLRSSTAPSLCALRAEVRTCVRDCARLVHHQHRAAHRW